MMTNDSTPTPDHAKLIVDGFRSIIDGLGAMGYPIEDDNFQGTVERAAKGFMELVKVPKDIDGTVAQMIQDAKFSADEADEMIMSRGNFCVGLCPHHLLPVIMRVTVAYIPNEKVWGISKLSRLCRLVSSKPDLQESITTRIARELFAGLDSKGSACQTIAFHTCMGLRGVYAHEAQVVMQKFFGAFKTQQETRSEFQALAGAKQSNILHG